MAPAWNDLEARLRGEIQAAQRAREGFDRLADAFCVPAIILAFIAFLLMSVGFEEAPLEVLPVAAVPLLFAAAAQLLQECEMLDRRLFWVIRRSGRGA